MACTGARPLGITDCLNFGNPEKPEVFFQFREACRGIADACRAFGTPVTGGNVSFYNESPTGAIDPTPTIGMVGLLERAEHRVPSFFDRAGDDVLILGATRGELGGSAYWAEIRGFVGGAAPSGGPRRRAAAAGLPGGGRGPGPAPVRPRRLGRRPAGRAGRGGDGRALRGGPDWRQARPRRLCPRRRARRAALSARTPAGSWHRRIRRTATSWSELARRAPGARLPGGPDGRTADLELRAGARVFSWVLESLRKTYFEAIPRRMQHADAERSVGE